MGHIHRRGALTLQYQVGCTRCLNSHDPGGSCWQAAHCSETPDISSISVTSMLQDVKYPGLKRTVYLHVGRMRMHHMALHWAPRLLQQILQAAS